MFQGLTLDSHLVLPTLTCPGCSAKVTDATKPNFLHNEVGLFDPLDQIAQKVLPQSLSH